MPSTKAYHCSIPPPPTHTDEWAMEELSTLISDKRSLYIFGDRWWPQKAEQEAGDKTGKMYSCNISKKHNGRPNLEVLEAHLLGAGKGMRGQWSNVLRQATDTYSPLPPGCSGVGIRCSCGCSAKLFEHTAHTVDACSFPYPVHGKRVL